MNEQYVSNTFHTCVSNFYTQCLIIAEYEKYLHRNVSSVNIYYVSRPRAYGISGRYFAMDQIFIDQAILVKIQNVNKILKQLLNEFQMSNAQFQR